MRRRRRSIAALTLPLASTAVGAVTVGTLTRLTEVARDLTPTTPVDRLVELGVTATGAGIGVWLTGSLLLATLCAAARLLGGSWRTGERAVARWAPRVVRRTLVSVAVAGVSLGMSGVAQAATPDPVSVDLGWVATAPAEPDAQPTETATQAAAIPGSTPTGSTAPPGADVAAPPDLEGLADDDASADRPVVPASAPHAAVPTTATSTTAAPTAVPTEPGATTVTAAPAPTSAVPASPAAAVEPATHQVQPGESLWSIAALYLPDGAAASEVAAAWPAWYSANRDVVGLDPDVIEPGQVLHAPAIATPTGDAS